MKKQRDFTFFTRKGVKTNISIVQEYSDPTDTKGNGIRLVGQPSFHSITVTGLPDAVDIQFFNVVSKATFKPGNFGSGWPPPKVEIASESDRQRVTGGTFQAANDRTIIPPFPLDTYSTVLVIYEGKGSNEKQTWFVAPLQFKIVEQVEDIPPKNDVTFESGVIYKCTKQSFTPEIVDTETQFDNLISQGWVCVPMINEDDAPPPDRDNDGSNRDRQEKNEDTKLPDELFDFTDENVEGEPIVDEEQLIAGISNTMLILGGVVVLMILSNRKRS